MHHEIWLRPLGQMLPPALATANSSRLVLLLATGGAAFLAWVVARRRCMPTLGRLSGALGVAIGWIFLVGVVIPPATLPERLPAASAVAAIFATLMAVPRLACHLRPALVGLAILLGWGLVGAPLSVAGLLSDASLLALTALWLLALAWLLLAADRWSLAAASLSLWAALHAVGAPTLWALLAIVPAASCATGPVPTRPATTPPVRKRGRKPRPGGKTKAAMIEAPAAPDLSRLPVALALAIVAAAAMAASHQIRLHLGATDAACLAPAAAIGIMARLRPRLTWLGPLSGAATTFATVALLALFAFSAAALSGLR